MQGFGPYCRRVMAVVLLCCLPAVGAVAQTVLMPVTGSGDTTMSYAVLYDDGDSTGPYSSFCNATYSFHTVAPGRYRIDVQSYLTNPSGSANLTIFDGPDVTGPIIAQYPSGSGGTFFSNGSNVTVKFVADDDMPTAGFRIVLCEYHNVVPSSVDVHFLDSNTFYIKWIGGTSNTMWIFDYAILCDSDDYNPATFFDDSTNYSTIVDTSKYYEFENIAVGCYIVYRIYTADTSPCMRYLIGEGPPFKPEEECPCVVPEGVDYTSVAGGVVVSWNYDTVSYWHFECAALGIDTILGGDDTSLFLPYDFPCAPPAFFMNGNCEDYCKGYSDYLPAGGCRRVASPNVVRTTGSTVELVWPQTSEEADMYLLYCRQSAHPADSNVLIATLPHDENTFIATGLNPHTYYTFTVHVLCGGNTLACNPLSTKCMTTLNECVDFINFLDVLNVHRTWGTYANPLASGAGLAGRHVVMLDTSQTDSYTGGALHCVPPGEEVSLRLGDANGGAMAETITYDYEVDSLDKDMLLLRYAVVLQNPNHDSSNQPHFSMEILDQSGALLDSNCCYADFSAGSLLGWNTVEGSNVIWKDWSTVGIDIAPYHGQKIKVRFTTKDCADGGHFGYAYFTIHCDSKRIAVVNPCDGVDSVVLRAPLGFDYRWTHGDDTTVLSTENEIRVPADSSVYLCHASFIERPECSFTIQSFAFMPELVPALHYEVDTCNKLLRLYNESYIDVDSVFLPYLRQTIDSVRWVVEGVEAEGDSVVIPLNGNHMYQFVLSCKLSESACYAELVDSLFVSVYRELTVSGETDVCQGDSVHLTASVTPEGSETITWPESSQGLYYVALADTTSFPYAVMHYFGCLDTVYHRFVVHRKYDDTLVAEICANQLFDSLGFLENQTGFYTHEALSADGCDSLLHLDLTAYPVFEDTIVASLCDSAYLDNGFEQDSTGFYTHRYTTVHGCDSVRHLDFVRLPVFRDTIVEEVYSGDTYVGHGFHEDATGFYELLYVDSHGCDSVYYLDLNVCVLQFPNAVTPNGDGYNDLFVIVNLLEAKMFDYTALWIYNRNGRLVFSGENFRTLSDFWNPEKTSSPDGTYYYYFIARSLSHEISHKGVIEVVR